MLDSTWLCCYLWCRIILNTSSLKNTITTAIITLRAISNIKDNLDWYFLYHVDDSFILFQREFGDECVFNETIEQHNYNTYSSTKYSNDRRTLYLALNRRGQPRKVLLRARQQLGRLSSYTRVLTRTVSPERAEELHPLRHRGHVCPPAPPAGEQNPTNQQPTENPRCRKKKKRKKKKRRCQEGDADGEPCHKRQTPTNTPKLQTKLVKQCDSKNSEECQRVEVTMKKKSKSKLSDTQVLSGFKKKKNKKHIKKRLRVSVSIEVTDSPAEDVSADEDYAVEATTAWDLDDSTALPIMPDETGTNHPDWLKPMAPSSGTHLSPLFISTIYCTLQVVHNCLPKWIYLSIDAHFLSLYLCVTLIKLDLFLKQHFFKVS